MSTRVVSVFLFVFACSMMGGNCTPKAEFINHMEETRKAVAPEYEKYVDADATLTPEKKERRKNTLKIWKETIEKFQKE